MIAEHIQEGRFTPFLGAGASSLRPVDLNPHKEPWVGITRTILRIAAALRTDQASSSEAYLYLRAFSEQRLLQRSGSREPLLPLDENKHPAWDRIPEPVSQVMSAAEEVLLPFQASLVRLAAQLSKSFGHAFATSYPAVDQVTDCKVEIDPSKEADGGLVRLITKLVDHARDLSCLAELESGRSRFRYTDIHLKLIVLTCELLNHDSWRTAEVDKWWVLGEDPASGTRTRSHRLASQALSRDLVQRSRRRETAIWLTMLQWLSDLLWYSLRYRIARYPTTAELAFELSLVVNDALPRRAELAQAAEALFSKQNDLVQCIAEIFSFYEEAIQRPSRFHLSILAVLYYMYLLRERKLEQRSDAASRLSGSRVVQKSRKTHVPVAFTTNFDRALERAFDRMGTFYHVVFPARQSDDSEKTSQVRWFFTTLRKGKRECAPKFCDDDLRNEAIKGPVIVKVHGSPLEDEPPDYAHWLVLSESGYLEALDPKKTVVPKWMELELQGAGNPTRSLWFLGYSVSDWNIRMRLYEHLSHLPGGDPEVNVKRSVIDLRGSRDWIQQAIFDHLKVVPYEGDLNRVPDIVLKALRPPQVEKDPLLERILEDLEGMAA